MTIDEQIDFWSYWLDLRDWKITTEKISRGQVYYDKCVPESDKYFIGIQINRERKIGIIYHDIDINYDSLLHELLHVRFPKFTEEEINERCNKILKGSRYGNCPSLCKHLYD
jgi:hypothetical protein